MRFATCPQGTAGGAGGGIKSVEKKSGKCRVGRGKVQAARTMNLRSEHSLSANFQIDIILPHWQQLGVF